MHGMVNRALQGSSPRTYGAGRSRARVRSQRGLPYDDFEAMLVLSRCHDHGRVSWRATAHVLHKNPNAG